MLLQYLKRKLPDVVPADTYLIPYFSFWTRLILQKQKPLIIGITGTAGKTTTTQMIAHVLLQDAARPYVGIVGKTPRSLNGDYGVRLSVLRETEYPDNWGKRIKLFLPLPYRVLKQVFSSKYPRVLVLEYGTFDAGHIKDLVTFAPAQIAIVINIGPAHLERHKTVEGVYFEKRALVQGAPPNGLVVLGSGHEFVERLRADSKAPVVVVDGRGIELAQNIARVVCKHLGLPENIIEAGLKSYEPPKSRLSQFTSGGITVIDDSYNANPLSMKLGLDTLADEKNKGRRVAMLGFMAELGDLSQTYHQEIGAYARERVDFLIGVGDDAKHYVPDYWFRTSAECAAQLDTLVQNSDIVLIKGSKASKMAVVVKHFKEQMSKTA
jgi:UDP-N-acetylmuramoyl-tripeptide--D-alanyl-D-alanine ligase